MVSSYLQEKFYTTETAEEIILKGKKKDILTNKNLSDFFETPVKINLHKNRFTLNFVA